MKITGPLLALVFLHQLIIAQEANNSKYVHKNSPVFQVDYSNPTADKPQSKLWYMDRSWWAILPRAAGPSLWQRTESGWIEHTDINEMLKGTPGRVDVWADENGITAVGVDSRYLVIFRLERIKKSTSIKWNAKKLATLYPPAKNESIETATITKDKVGHLWVAAVAEKKVCVWNSVNENQKWEGPNILADGIDDDDICTIVTLPEGVGVIWSDQVKEAVRIRIHLDGQPTDKWEQITTIEEGNKTADDHLNTTLSSDGTLWLVTKNSVDIVGKPQFVMRVRTPQGEWHNYPYANLDSVKHPSRPIIISVEGDSSMILSGYTIYNSENPYLGKIIFGMVDTTKLSILTQEIPVIVPNTKDWIGIDRINDVTGPKMPFPCNAPWIVLASDKMGRVYESELSLYFNQK